MYLNVSCFYFWCIDKLIRMTKKTQMRDICVWVFLKIEKQVT